ncbi:hypothetical protein FOXG_19616 [Fusarium oxysporum f. sp. lycopersici 4287]|uniref:Uncharacterized protein n=1 Tax=Fusarium oxysporum f. sp. lycopersici (strain 4287 / CBS 123668 / FGSC 9935 / NRRL 34936) TaxID=426428 RepID=A0A0J9WMX0_FUSO4|nr:hypothetical protein FOXG_19616 [Fusarium oxysporum f. sp. lycopersici 4287]KNB06267.1 hypothetical protein FOXG_19616 [Fusarium oxysporum f. sp. lycopersici 4287]
MNPHIKEAQSRRPRSSDEMDELQNGAPEFEDIPSADMCYHTQTSQRPMHVCLRSVLRDPSL